MNKYILTEAVNGISDVYIAESASYKIKKSNNLKKIITVCAACVICVFGIWYASPGNSNDNNKPNVADYYILNSEQINAGSNISRTGTLTPLSPGCTERKMSKKELKRFFQHSDFDLFNERQSEYTLILNKDETVHSVIMKWYFDGGCVYAVFDPDTYPEFLFNADCGKTENFHNYRIAIHKTDTGNGNYELDVGIKSEKTGIWIYGNEKCSKQIEELMNFLFNNPVSFNIK